MTYLPEAFAQHDRDRITEFLAIHPFATLVTLVDSAMLPTPVPLIYRPSDTGWGSFIGHAAIANDLWKHDPGTDVLVIFSGPDAYITPNWYATKQESHKVVPTWNYLAVHAWGQITFRHDAKFKRMAVGRLTQIHERASQLPWKMADAPRDYIESQLDHIVGFEIDITRLVAKWKLNRNRSDADRTSVLQGLADRNHHDDELIRNAMIETFPANE